MHAAARERELVEGVFEEEFESQVESIYQRQSYIVAKRLSRRRSQQNQDSKARENLNAIRLFRSGPNCLNQIKFCDQEPTRVPRTSRYINTFYQKINGGGVVLKL